MQVLANFEYLGEDKEVAGAKIFHVEAIHVTTTGNRRKFTATELDKAARSLSYRPLNINHDSSRTLEFPENMTMPMEFNASKRMIEGHIRVFEPEIIKQIEKKQIVNVSIEQIPTKGETCNEISCEQHGVAFIGMALLERDVMPGDPNARIKLERLQSMRIESLLVSDAQRICLECTDWKACHKCVHKAEIDRQMHACLDDIQRDQPHMAQDDRVIHCLELLNRVNKPAFRDITIRLNEQNDCMSKCLSAKKAKGTKIDDQAIAICLSECGLSRNEVQWYFYKINKEKFAE